MYREFGLNFRTFRKPFRMDTKYSFYMTRVKSSTFQIFMKLEKSTDILKKLKLMYKMYKKNTNECITYKCKTSGFQELSLLAQN